MAGDGPEAMDLGSLLLERSHLKGRFHYGASFAYYLGVRHIFWERVTLFIPSESNCVSMSLSPESQVVPPQKTVVSHRLPA